MGRSEIETETEVGLGMARKQNNKIAENSSWNARGRQLAAELGAREVFPVGPGLGGGETETVEFHRYGQSQPNGAVWVRIEVWISRAGERRLEGSISQGGRRGRERWTFRSVRGWGKVLEGGSWQTAAEARREVRGWVRWEMEKGS